MSKIEVNTVAPQCGTTLTLGESGDTVTLGSGASQSGFGRTGTVDWDTTPKTASFTADTGDGYFVNTTSGAITVTLPAGTANAIVSLADYAATWQTNNVTVTPNGTDKIGGENENAILDTKGHSVTLVYVDGTQGWINTMDSTSNVRGLPPFVAATGGTVTCCGDFKIHTFTGPGTFTVTSAGTPVGSNTVDYLVVAGGGGGGAGHPSSGAAGSGAGAGGYRESSGTSSGCYTVSPLGACVSALPVSVQGYPIVVGGGGAGACSLAPAPGPTKASCGSNSSFSTITSTAGGYGGSRSWGSPPNGGSGTNTNCRSDGGPGGSGGGGNVFCAPSQAVGTIGTGNTPPVSPPQGQNGGVYSSGTNGGVSGGGATGAGATNNPGPSSAAGGAGATSSINGTPTGRAGGGGGGLSASGAGGGTASDGGGAGGPTPGGTGSNGTANTGGGAGGGGSGGDGGLGGSGIVIIRYKFQ